MASSSHHSHQTLNNSSNNDEGHEGNASKEEEWLQLGLGLGFCTSSRKIECHGSDPVSESPSPSPPSPVPSQIVLGLRLEQSSSLGPYNDNEGLRDVAEGSNRWSDNCYYYHDHRNNNNKHNGMLLWPSSSTWQMDSDQDWQVPVPCDSHNYFTRSPHESGLWFTLCSTTNRSGEALPQIPKAYIRVKDENTTVSMVKKYLVRKLGLSNESEIDISCMGQSLSHMQTLKQVRDTVWLPKLVESVNSTTVTLENTHGSGMSTKHLMSLLYRKNRILN